MSCTDICASEVFNLGWMLKTWSAGRIGGRIPKAIRTSDAIIICLSKNSINKEGFVQAEITFALEKALEVPQGRIFIIPARFEDCEVPNNLEHFHWVDLFEEDGFPRLMKSLRTRASQLERSNVQVSQPDETTPNFKF
ncbi:MAG: toll/interleukin-1 receptor domain-containing protein [Chitinophagaceae bacterium]